ncbi:MAG: CARDB domain-containing protein [Halobacteriota archaeon]
MRRVLVLVVIALVAFQPVGVPVASAATDDTIVRTTTLSLTPDEPGSVDATVSFDVPSNVGSLTTTVPDDASVTQTTGFERNDDGTYTWDGDGPAPQLTMSVQANRTGVGLRHVETDAADESMQSGYEFVDTGPWAMVSAPSMSTEWRYRGDKPSFETNLETDGDGVAGERMAFLGPTITYQRTAHGQTFTLVVPDGATLEPEPDAILDSLEAASASLRVDERDPRVTLFAVPTGIDWAAQGLAGDADAWVLADRPLDSPDNVWLHEYVHTRSDYRTTEDARWITEGTAEYYAALLTLEQGHIGFDEFERHLDGGSSSRYESAVLSRPDTWTAGANYRKGALVFGNLDYRLRTTTDSTYTGADVLARMNDRDELVSHSFLLDVVTEAGGQSTGDFLERYATTDATPEVWTRHEHSEAFTRLPPRMVVDDDHTFEIAGPYRNTSVSSLPILVAGETVTVNATVTNQGDVAGEYDLSFVVDDESVDSVVGTLDADESRTVDFTRTFEGPGTHEVRIGESRFDVIVEQPATPRITSLTATDRTISPGEAVEVAVTATNEADKPATGDVSIRLDGTTVSTWKPMLDAGETATTTRQVTIEEVGDHVIAVGDQRVEVAVDGETESSPGTTTSTPGFGFGIGVVAILLSAGYATIRRE